MFTILGASGFIGSALVAALRESGEECFPPARDDASILSRPLGHVIYAIGMTADFRSRPFATARAHVAVLADIMEKADFESLTYLSSTRVYAGCANTSPDSRLSVDPTDPSDLYNTTKLAGESLCLNGGKDKTRVVRLSNVVGVAESPSANFIDEIVRDALDGRVVMRSAPESAKDYILIDDVVRLLPTIATQGTQPIYNLASGRNLRNVQWTDLLREKTGCEVIYEHEAPVWEFPEIEIDTTCREFRFSPGVAFDILPALLSRYSHPS
jgi:nucleoside-diphosphate-sugar epimerase